MREDPDHHKKINEFSLESLDIDMVGQFVLDHMHVVCIGVMKRLVKQWIKSPIHNKRQQLSSSAYKTLAKAVIEFRSFEQ